MNFETAHQEFLLFAAGLSLLALARLCFVATWRHAERSTWKWLTATLASLGLSDWLAALARHLIDAPLCRLAALIFAAAATVALIEFGLRVASQRRTGLLNRWAYLPFTLLVAGGWWLAPLTWLDLAVSLVLAWQAAVILVGYLTASGDWKSMPRTTYLIVLASALLALLPSNCLHIQVLRVLALLVACGAAWLAYRAAQPTAARANFARQYAPPALFLAALAAGWLLLGNTSDAAADTAQFVAAAVKSDSVELLANSATNPLALLLWKVGLCLLPIGLFVALIAGLKRIPGMH